MNISIISKYRTQLMGVAILWISFLHASMWFPFDWINWLFKLIGQGGVDIFFFLSSFGLFYAFQKEKSPAVFLRRRFLRILPYAIPVALLRIIYLHYNLYNGSLLITGLAFFVTGDRSMWFISAILVCYLVTPFYLKAFTGREKTATLIATLGSLGLSFLFFNTNYIVFFSRLPIFFLGFYVGWLSYHQKSLTNSKLVIAFVLMIIGFGILRYSWRFGEDVLWGYGLYWYPFILISFPFCLLLSAFFAFCEKKKLTFITSFFASFGKISLSFYLLHEIVLRIMTDHFVWKSDFYNIGFNVFVIFIVFCLAWLYQSAIENVIPLIKSKHH